MSLSAILREIAAHLILLAVGLVASAVLYFVFPE